MKLKTTKLLNHIEIEEAERLQIPIPEKIIDWDDFWFFKEDIKMAYVTDNDNINVHFNNGDYYTIPKNKETIEFLNQHFKEK